MEKLARMTLNVMRTEKAVHVEGGDGETIVLQTEKRYAFGARNSSGGVRALRMCLVASLKDTLIDDIIILLPSLILLPKPVWPILPIFFLGTMIEHHARDCFQQAKSSY